MLAKGTLVQIKPPNGRSPSLDHSMSNDHGSLWVISDESPGAVGCRCKSLATGVGYVWFLDEMEVADGT